MVTDLTKTSTTIDGVAVDAGTVKFKMDHLLSQIKFQAKLKAQYTGATKITVTGFKLSLQPTKLRMQEHIHLTLITQIIYGCWIILTTT